MVSSCFQYDYVLVGWLVGCYSCHPLGMKLLPRRLKNSIGIFFILSLLLFFYCLDINHPLLFASHQWYWLAYQNSNLFARFLLETWDGGKSSMEDSNM
mmetsp:Transcript_22053/g.54481  ORF Transcript_22053/g.54481 Transcript_22053/m.54481 type:complete len:98 (-) Transcript_22053:44-337(-)